MVAPPAAGGTPMYYMPTSGQPQMMQAYPAQYTAPQPPQAVYAPPGELQPQAQAVQQHPSAHVSSYGGYYEPQPRGGPDGQMPMVKHEMHSDSPGPVDPSAMSTVSSNDAAGHHQPQHS